MKSVNVVYSLKAESTASDDRAQGVSERRIRVPFNTFGWSNWKNGVAIGWRLQANRDSGRMLEAPFWTC